MAETTDKSLRSWPPKMAVCVGAVVLHERKMLFVRQATGHSLAGQWTIPWGLVDEGEAPEAAALRETAEESGITAAIDGLLGIQNLATPGWIGIIFACHAVAGELSPDGIETDRAVYFSLEELVSTHEPFEPWCKWLALRVLRGEAYLIPEHPDTPYAPSKGFL